MKTHAVDHHGGMKNAGGSHNIKASHSNAGDLPDGNIVLVKMETCPKNKSLMTERSSFILIMEGLKTPWILPTVLIIAS
jgi:hypothetical protein